MVVPVEGRIGDAVSIRPLFTVGDAIGSYRPPGLLDGIGAFAIDSVTTRILVTHEIVDRQGYAWSLANGTRLTGARITQFDVDRRDYSVRAAGPAVDVIIDRNGRNVRRADQINERSRYPETDGLDRLCSAVYVAAGDYGMRDNIFFAGEENREGTLYALDVDARTLHAVPAAGRAQFENVAPVETGEPETVAFLMSDDNHDAPLYLYVGRRGAADSEFLERNGLGSGDVYVWVSADGDTSSNTFFGTGRSRAGRFVKIRIRDAARAGEPGYDASGWATMARQHALARAAGAFAFDSPEDVATNPGDASGAIIAVTGNEKKHPGNTWGTILRIDVAFTRDAILGSLTILFDGDDAGSGQFPHADAGLRSPDNVAWASDGMVYVQEDRATKQFGLTSGKETSIWRVDPDRGGAVRLAMIDRTAVPAGQADTLAAQVGVWETSGIVDVTTLFAAAGEERLFLAAVQAHSLAGPPLGGPDQPHDLVRGGQLVLLSVRPARQ